MTPQEIAKSIADELREHPERWTQGALARDASGREVHHRDDAAACWCLEGLIYKHGRHNNTRFVLMTKAIDAVMGLDVRPCDYNDFPGRTVDDIIALCEKVANS